MHGRVTRYPGISQYLQASGAHIGPTSINSKNWFLRIPGPIIQRSDMFAHRKKKKKRGSKLVSGKRNEEYCKLNGATERQTDKETNAE